MNNDEYSPSKISDNSPSKSPHDNIDKKELHEFTMIVKQWLLLDNQISDREKEIRLLKKRRNKELEPQIINFMKNNNISNLNTENGNLKCVEKNTKQALNKTNIKNNLSEIIEDELLLEKAMDQILNNRESKITHKLTKSKKLS